MFVLRKITGLGVEMNFCLGENYSLVTKKENPKEFKKAIKAKLIVDDPIVYGYVNGDNMKIHGISAKQENYIMTENGKTFVKLNSPNFVAEEKPT